MPSKKPIRKNSGLHLVTPEERQQADELAAEHPWSLTLRQFLAKVESEYGLSLKRMTATDPYGESADMWYLQSKDKKTTVHLPGLEDFDEQLTEETTGSLCRRIGVPPEDFGLKPEEPVGDDEVFDLGD